MSTLTTQLMCAVEEHRAGRFEEAERIYRRLLKREPGNGEVLKLLGALCGATRRPERALHFLGKATRILPDDPGVHYNLGNVLRQEQRLTEAIDEYRSATRLAPHHASAQFNLAVTCLELGRIEEAIGALRNAIEADDRHVGAHHQLATLLFDSGAVEEAAAHWLAAVQIDPDSAEYHLNLGLALHRLGRLEEAAGAFETVTRLDGDRADGWCNLGGTLRTLGRLEESVAALQHALRLDDELLPAYTNLACAHLDRKEAMEALRASRAALAVRSDHAPAHRTAAAALVLGGEHTAAEQELRAAAELDPHSPDIAAELGDVLRRLDRFDEADREYERALSIDPGFVDAQMGRVTVRQQRGATAEALALAEMVLHDHPDRFAAIISAAKMYITRRRFEDAADLLKPLTQRRDLTAAQQRRLHFRLGEALDKLGEYDAAWEAYTRANRLTAQRFDRAELARQVDATVRLFTRQRLERMPRAEAAGPRPIFIVGMPRSGTTLIEQILACHEDVAGGGELYIGGRTAARIADGDDEMLAHPWCIESLEVNHIQALARVARDELARIAGDRPITTDKSPQNLHYLGMLELLFPHARVIVCHRDPLDTCLSCYFCDFAGAHPYAYDLEDLGFFYRMHDRLIDHWAEALRIPMMTIQYEQLVNEQEPVTRQLLSFCDLPWHEQCLAFHRNPRAVHTASAEQVRQPIYRTSIGRHRHYERHLASLIEALKGDAGPKQPVEL